MTPVDPELRDDGGERDAHLLAALRHAPDRDALPPPAISAAILANARAAVQGGTAPRRWWHAIDAWMLRPQWAAAFGTLAVAGLVALMWSVQEPPPPEPKSAAAAPTAMPATPARAPAAEQDAAQDAAHDKVASGAQAPAADSRMREQGTVLRSAPESQPAKAASPPPRSATLPKPGAGAEARSPRPAEAEATSALGRNAAAIEPSAERRALADEASSGARADSPQSPATTSSADGRVRQEAATPAFAAKRAAAPDDPLLRLDPLLARAPGDVTWRSAGKAWPHGQAQRRWWAQLSEVSRGRWQRDERIGDAAAPWLVLAAGPTDEAVFWTDGSTLRLQLGTERWQAALPEPTLRELKDAVSGW